METKKYREVLLQYINNQNPEQMILTSQITQYAAKCLGVEEDAIKKTVNVNMARLEKAGYIVRVSKGIYCRKITTPFGAYTPNKEKLFCEQLLRGEDEIIGYETGLIVLNQMGLVSQMPKNRCIATNLHKKRVPEGLLIEIQKPATAVNAANFRYLQLLDAIQNMEKAPVDAFNPEEIVRRTARELELRTDLLILMARKYYSQKTLLKTIDIMLGERNEAARG